MKKLTVLVGTLAMSALARHMGPHPPISKEQMQIAVEGFKTLLSNPNQISALVDGHLIQLQNGTLGLTLEEYEDLINEVTENLKIPPPPCKIIAKTFNSADDGDNSLTKEEAITAVTNFATESVEHFSNPPRHGGPHDMSGPSDRRGPRRSRSSGPSGPSDEERGHSRSGSRGGPSDDERRHSRSGSRGGSRRGGRPERSDVSDSSEGPMERGPRGRQEGSMSGPERSGPRHGRSGPSRGRGRSGSRRGRSMSRSERSGSRSGSRSDRGMFGFRLFDSDSDSRPEKSMSRPEKTMSGPERSFQGPHHRPSRCFGSDNGHSNGPSQMDNVSKRF